MGAENDPTYMARKLSIKTFPETHIYGNINATTTLRLASSHLLLIDSMNLELQGKYKISTTAT